MKNIYEKHDVTFSGISAYVIPNSNPSSRLATIAFKRNCKSGNVQCFFHVIGFQMQYGSAGGGGYDKCSAAFYEAATKHYEAVKGEDDNTRFQALQIIEAAKKGNGSSQWVNALRDYGFNLLQAV